MLLTGKQKIFAGLAGLGVILITAAAVTFLVLKPKFPVNLPFKTQTPQTSPQPISQTKSCPSTKVTLDIPDNWHLKELDGENGMKICVVSEKPYEASNTLTPFKPDSGAVLAIDAMQNSSKVYHATSSAVAKRAVVALDKLSRTKKTITLSPINKVVNDPFVGYETIADVKNDPQYGDFDQMYYIVANQKTDTFYQVLFTSSKTTWEKDWKTGLDILKTMVLDPGF